MENKTNNINDLRRLAKIAVKYSDRFEELGEPILADFALEVAKDCYADVDKKAKVSPSADTSVKEKKSKGKCYRCKGCDDTVSLRKQFNKDLCSSCFKETKYISADGKYIYPKYKHEKEASFGDSGSGMGGGFDASWSSGGESTDAPDFFGDDGGSSDFEHDTGMGMSLSVARQVLLAHGCPSDELDMMSDDEILEEAKALSNDGDMHDGMHDEPSSFGESTFKGF